MQSSKGLHSTGADDAISSRWFWEFWSDVAPLVAATEMRSDVAGVSTRDKVF